MQQWLLVFDSTHHAMAAEARVKEAGGGVVSFQTIPTPRQITASCGLSLLFSGELNPEEMLELLKTHHIKWAGLYHREGEGKTPWTPVNNPVEKEEI